MSVTAACSCACTHCLGELLQAGLVELAYAACLLEEQGSWQTTDEAAAGSLSVCNNGRRLSEHELAVMAEQLAQQLTSPQDQAAAATAALQASAVHCESIL
eukprot:GHUV01006464.1.p2 GENE.GHUV01006464.1~~GHUV01006464.1.p2  ORF type:complete len:101 (-),score=31.31 GHUV01006464.1:72-374(-)